MTAVLRTLHLIRDSHISWKTLLKCSTIDCSNFPNRSNKPRKLNQPLGYVPCLNEEGICGVDVFLMPWIKSQFAVLRWSQILRCAMFVFFSLQCSVKWNYLRSCGFLCDWVMQWSLIFFAVLRCSGPPMSPSLTEGQLFLLKMFTIKHDQNQ